MEKKGFYHWVDNQRKGQHHWGAWLALVILLVILYMMGIRHWHVINLFIFVPIFVALCFVLILAVGWLQPGDES